VSSLPRLVGGALADRLAVMATVVVTGAQQTGKSTLAEQLVTGERRYRTLDTFDGLAAGFPPADVRGLPAPGAAAPPDRTGARRGAAATRRASLTQSARNLLPARALAGLCREPQGCTLENLVRELDG
jgi:hypothetical protein